MSKSKRIIKYKPIEPLIFPEIIKNELSGFTDKMMLSLKENGPSVESCKYDIGKLNSDELFVYTIFIWFSEITDIIDNLNLILCDLSELPEKHLIFSGSPKQRFYLLIRTYFNEFYRTREIFAQILHGLKSQNRITKAEVKGIRKTYHDAFKDMHDLRNSFVHDSPDWHGKEHHDLVFIGSAWDMGKIFKHNETGEIWNIQDVLYNSCQKQTPILAEEGMRMQVTMQNLINIITDLLNPLTKRSSGTNNP